MIYAFSRSMNEPILDITAKSVNNFKCAWFLGPEVWHLLPLKLLLSPIKSMFSTDSVTLMGRSIPVSTPKSVSLLHSGPRNPLDQLVRLISCQASPVKVIVSPVGKHSCLLSMSLKRGFISHLCHCG